MSDAPTPIDDAALETILDDFAVSVPGPPSYADLAPWLARYPRYARELTEFAAEWALTMIFAPEPDAATEPDSTRLARDMAIARRLQDETRPPIRSLVREAEQNGSTAPNVAARTKISRTIFAKLDRRLIHAATIPAPLIDDLAAAIGRGAEAVRTYLQGDATLPAGAMYRSTTAPAIRGGENGEDFFVAVAADTTMAAEDRAAWLALAPPPEHGA